MSHEPATPITGDPDFTAVRCHDHSIEILTTGSPSVQHEKQLAKRSHDVKAALRTLQMAIESLHAGYRFDDAMAGRKLSAMDKALACLKAQEPLLLATFQAARKSSSNSQS